MNFGAIYWENSPHDPTDEIHYFNTKEQLFDWLNDARKEVLFCEPNWIEGKDFGFICFAVYTPLELSALF